MTMTWTEGITAQQLRHQLWAVQPRHVRVEQHMSGGRDAVEERLAGGMDLGFEAERPDRQAPASSSTIATRRFPEPMRHSVGPHPEAQQLASGPMSRRRVADHQPDEVGEGCRFHLLHDAGAVHLDRLLRNAEVVGDLLVEPSAHDPVEYLSLSGRKPGEPLRELRPIAVRRVRCGAEGQCTFDRGEERRGVHPASSGNRRSRPSWPARSLRRRLSR